MIRFIRRSWRSFNRLILSILKAPFVLLRIPTIWWRRAARLFKLILLWPIHAFIAAWGRRESRHLLQGSPALVGMIATVVLAMMAVSQKTNLADSYREVALRSMREGKYEDAKIYFERLVELEDAIAESQYDLALILMQTGESERALAIMNRLAPEKGNGYAKAHLWKANSLLSKWEQAKQKEELSPEKLSELLKSAYSHLISAQKGNAFSPEVQFSLSLYYMAIKQPKLAAEHLEKAAREKKDLYFELSRLYAQIGERDLAFQAARRADSYYTQYVKANAEDENARLLWASTKTNLGDFPAALSVLEEGLSLNPNGPFQQAIAQAYIVQYDRLTSSKRTPGQKYDPAGNLALIRKALAYDPGSEQALIRLVRFGESNQADVEQAKRLLEALLATGPVPATVHLALGVKSWKENDLDKAGWHLERAYTQDEKLGVIANNLAWVLAYQKNPELKRAKRIIDSVVQKWPDNPEFRDTRGQILLKMEKWSDALDDFELALARYPNRAELHQTLALVYRKLNHSRLAQYHEKVAQEIEENQQ